MKIRYSIKFSQLVNQLTPYFMMGRNWLNYLHALTTPLQQCNTRFNHWAEETKIAAAMTSQVFYLEWYLNRQLGNYLSNGKIVIEDAIEVGQPLWHEGAVTDDVFAVWMRGEGEPFGNPDSPKPLYRVTDKLRINRASYIVNVPKLKGMSEKNFTIQLANILDRYTIAGKRYAIVINK